MTLFFSVPCEQIDYKSDYNILKSYILDFASDIKLTVFTSFPTTLFSVQDTRTKIMAADWAKSGERH